MDSAADVAKRWAARTAAETGKWESGVRNVSVSPTELAAQNVNAQVAGVQRAAASGKTERALRRVSKEEWVRRTTAKRDRLASGTQEAIPRMQAYMSEALPVIARIRAEVKAMDGSSREARMARAMAFMQKMAEFGDSRNGN